MKKKKGKKKREGKKKKGSIANQVGVRLRQFRFGEARVRGV